MNDKFFPTYQLEIETSNGSIVIPNNNRYFNITASINYAYSESPNTCDISIYNLNKASRDAIFFDAWDYFTFRKVTFKAGYNGNLQMLFNGNIKEAYSDRNGADVSTHISAWDNFWYINNYTEKNIFSGADRNQVLTEILSDLKTNEDETANIIMSDFTDEPDNLRMETLKGRPQDLVKERIGQDASLFFDDGTIYVLKDNDAIGDENGIPVINSASGLLGVPVKRNRIVEFKMLFEPSLRIGRAFKLESNFSDILNGTYKVLSVSHSLSLGENIGGENTTTVRAWNSNQGFNFIGFF